MNRKRLNILVSPGFIICLTLLLLNDFFLKALLRNWFTGKLSDLAGMFIFPLFWIALFPELKIRIYVATALCFIFWKSAFSDLLINTWNDAVPLPIGRTVDYSDLVALTVLPLSYLYAQHVRKTTVGSFAPYLIGALSLIAFTATQFRSEVKFDDAYTFEDSKASMINKIQILHSIDYFGRTLSPENEPDTFEIHFDSCNETAIINIKGELGHSVITLRKIVFRCPGGGNKREMLQFFEKEFIEKLREEKPGPSSVIHWIWLSPRSSSTGTSSSRFRATTQSPLCSLVNIHCSRM